MIVSGIRALTSVLPYSNTAKIGMVKSRAKIVLLVRGSLVVIVSVKICSRSVESKIVEPEISCYSTGGRVALLTHQPQDYPV